MNIIKCRFCGTDCVHRLHVNIFDVNYSFVKLLIEKVLRYFPDEDDGFSKYICNECLAKIDKMNSFLETSIKCLFSPEENVEGRTVCKICGFVRNCESGSANDVQSKLAYLVGFEIDELSYVCIICTIKIDFFHDFIGMVNATLSSPQVQVSTGFPSPNITIKQEIPIVEIKQEIPRVEIKQEPLDVPVDCLTSDSGVDTSCPIGVSIKEESVDHPTDCLTSEMGAEEFVKNMSKEPTENMHKRTDRKRPRYSLRKKVVSYVEEDSNPDSPDSNFDPTESYTDTDDDSVTVEHTQLPNLPSTEADGATPANVVKDLRQQPTIMKETVAPKKRTRIYKETETKLSSNLIYSNKNMGNGRTVVHVSVRTEYLENFKHIKLMLGDGVYFTSGDKVRSNDPNAYKAFLIKCIENILQGRANLMAYLRNTTFPGEKRLEFKCFACATTIHNKMIRQAVYAHLIMHLVMLCPTCGLLKGSISDMSYHLKSHSKSLFNYKFECKICSKEFSKGPEIYFSHLMSHFKLFNCVRCGFSTNEVESFSEHHERVCGRAACEGDCSATYKDHPELVEHLDRLCAENEGTSYVCSNCKMGFHSKETVSIHYDILGHQHSQIERLVMKEEATCPIDNLPLLKRYETTRDYSDFELDDQNNCKCPFCLRDLYKPSTDYINKHMNFHVLLACRACENSPIYQDFKSYRNHVLFEHPPIIIACKICKNTSFHDVDLFLSHILQHI